MDYDVLIDIVILFQIFEKREQNKINIAMKQLNEKIILDDIKINVKDMVQLIIINFLFKIIIYIVKVDLLILQLVSVNKNQSYFLNKS